MKYFELLPKITYKFGNVEYEVANIFTRIGLNENFFNSQDLYYQERRENQTSPDKTSFEKYQTFDYYWLLMLANNVYDINKDWPINQKQLGDLLDIERNKKSYYIYEQAEILQNDILFLNENSYGIIQSWNPFTKEIVIKQQYGSLPVSNFSQPFEIRRLKTDGSYIKLSNYCDPQTTVFNVFGCKPYLDAPFEIKTPNEKRLNAFLKVTGSDITEPNELLLDTCGSEQITFQNSLIYKVVNNQTVNGIKVVTNESRILSEYVEKTTINIISPSIASMYEDKAKQLLNDPSATANTMFRIG